jgi:hypothetical protein
MELTEDRYLEHYGVLGMKWGVRRSHDTLTRHRGALIDRNARIKASLRARKSGKAYKATAAIGRAFMGEKRLNASWDKRMSKLDAQDKRLRSGKLFIRDRLDLALNVPTLDLLVSRRPTKFTK